MTGAGSGEAPAEAATKRRRLERHAGVSKAPAPPPPPPPPPSPSVCFHMEDLPEEIQQYVLSLLPLKEAARTSLVSKNWRKLWTRYPTLCFDSSKDDSTDTDNVKIERRKFIETVNSIIQQHSGIGLDKFSVRCSLIVDSSDILNRWICFAIASKTKIIDMNLSPKLNYVGPTKQAHHFPLEALGAQDHPFIQCLFLTNVSIKPCLDKCGFRKLRSLHLHCIQSIGDLSGLLLCCSILEDLELIACSGVADLNIPQQLDKLRHLLVSNMRVQMVGFNVPNLLILGTKVHIDTLTTRPACMFLNLRHLTYEILSFTKAPNRHSGILQLSWYLAFAPQLETLELHMMHYVPVTFGDCWHGEGVPDHMHRHDHLKTVYMSGFRCYRSQVELLCGILETAAVSV